MQISSRFTIAVHICACLHAFEGKYRLTSDFLASSVNVNPVIIRNILAQLKVARIVSVARGSGGACLICNPETTTLLDVYRAIDPIENNQLFHFHENPNPDCPVGRSIHEVLDAHLISAQKAMEEDLAKNTLADLFAQTDQAIENQEQQEQTSL
ncbi:Rrf2 family transcriptional regulator [Allobaculum sp. JKK-2023]|uniref:Rrf2 family transcriptional regulator n=1 Tax=Allobaculum sp. JKK-2023 TaxID=3108943 RepID=UPI002B05E7B8|nr:Rrf2 family transcriptional regulator [Allobaculum sp. JKK-2023]